MAAAWQAFFHEPGDLRAVALVRVAFALVVLVNFVVLYPDLDRWFTDSGVLSSATSKEIARPYTWSLLWLLPSTSGTIQACFWIAAAQAAMLLFGFCSRLNCLCLFVWLVSFQNRNFLITDSEDTVMRLIAFYLVFMPIGQCWSVDAWLRRRLWPNARTNEWRGGIEDQPESGTRAGCWGPLWGLRLLQIQMCVIFLSAGISKLNGDAWLDGTAIYYVARLDDYFGRLPTPDWPFDHPWPVAIATWGVIAVEILAPFFLWFRETRRPTLVLVVLFHLANEWTMNLLLFHWAMLAGWLSFVQPADFLWLWPHKKG
jgi:uncharacterized membrane protein YphA (DoxX/SURF4 family)